MAENVTLKPSASCSDEAHSRKMPFAPIFDTIVVEPPSEAPSRSKKGSTKVSAQPDAENSAVAGSMLFDQQNTRSELASKHGRWLTWTMAVGVVAIVIGMIYLNHQLRKQRQALAELANTSSQLASTLADNRRLDQRPWVTIADLVPQSLPMALGSFNISLQNLGRTPALDVKLSATAQLTGSSELAGTLAIAPVNRNAGTLLPGSRFKTVLDFRPLPAALAGLYRGQSHLVLRVNVTYNDIFQTSHANQACWSWQPAFRQLEPCNGYGTVN